MAQHTKQSWLAVGALLLCYKNFQRDSAIRYSRFDWCRVMIPHTWSAIIRAYY